MVGLAGQAIVSKVHLNLGLQLLYYQKVEKIIWTIQN